MVPWEQDINHTMAKMGNKPSFPLDTPLGCHWKGYQLEGLKKEKLTKYCTQYWPAHSLGGGKKQPR